MNLKRTHILYYLVWLAMIVHCVPCYGTRAKASVFLKEDAGFIGSLKYLEEEELLKKSREYARQSRLDSTLTCLLVLSARLSPAQNPRQRDISANALNDAGVCYYILGDIRNAYLCFMQAMETEIPHVVNSATNNIAGIYYNFGMKEEGAKYLRKGYEYAKLHDDTLLLAVTHSNLLNYYLSVDSLSSFRKEMIAFPDIRGNVEGRKSGLFNEAMIAQEAGNSDKAASILSKMLADGKTIKMNHRDSLRIMGALAMVYMGGGNTTASRDLLMETLGNIDEDNGEELIGIYDMLVKCSRMAANKEEELKWKEKYINVRDSLFGPAQLADLKDYSASFTINEIKSELERSQLEARQRRLLVTTLSIGLILAILFILVIVWLYRKLQRDHDVLYRQSLEHARLVQTPCPIAEKLDHTVEKTETSEETCGSADTPKGDKSTNGEETIPQDKLMEYAESVKLTLGDSGRWTNSDYSVHDLARDSHVSLKFLPEVIRYAYNTNFYGLLADLRIHEACRRLSDVENYGNLTVEGIAQSLGYKSRSAFSRLFKEKTGLSPTDYVKAARRSRK